MMVLNKLNEIKYNIHELNELGGVVKYEKEFGFGKIGINEVPQWFIYISDEQYEKCVNRR